MGRSSPGAIARRKTGVFDALCRHLCHKREKVWRRSGVDATARIVDFVVALHARKRWALAKGEGSRSMRDRDESSRNAASITHGGSMGNAIGNISGARRNSDGD